MSKAEEEANKRYRITRGDDTEETSGIDMQRALDFIEGYQQAEKDVAEAFARIIRGNLGGIGNGIQNMFEKLYADITGEKMYKGFID
jgi:hypothetical protein